LQVLRDYCAELSSAIGCSQLSFLGWVAFISNLQSDALCGYSGLGELEMNQMFKNALSICEAVHSAVASEESSAALDNITSLRDQVMSQYFPDSLVCRRPSPTEFPLLPPQIECYVSYS